jgi:glycosyltransferase involved in cell wall biosynthesis
MRITFILKHAYISGGDRVIAVQAQELIRRGHTVNVISAPRPILPLKHRLRNWLTGEAKPPANGVVPCLLDEMQVPHRIIETSRPIVDTDVPDADVVIATWWETAPWVWRLSVAKGAKAYFIQHYEIWGGDATDVEATWLLPMHKIVVSSWLAKLARERFNDGTASYVPNAVDTHQFTAPPRQKQPTPTIGFMYSTTHFKGCDISLAAFECARQSIPGLRLVAFGAEPPARHLPLPADCEFTLRPAQEKIRDIYARCDAWLVGSRSEGFGLPILEAMACRTPVIATPAGAAPELLEGGAGILVKPDDPADMAAAIERIAALSLPAWQSLSDTAYAKASRYTWQQAGELMERALQTAISARY